MSRQSVAPAAARRGARVYPVSIVPELTDREKDSLREALLTLREELSDMLASSEGDAAPVDLEEPIGRLSRMDAMQQQNMIMANRRAARSRLQQTHAALTRFDEDEYGDCLDCGEAIDFRRLVAKPESLFCLKCQNGREQRR